MYSFETIEVIYEHDIATIWLNRPEVHNAFNHTLVLEIMEILNLLENQNDLRILILRGKGKSFCSGADLNWMRDVVEFDYEKNYIESLQLAKCLQTLYQFPVPVIAFAHGSVMGGGNGFLATADFAIGTKNTRFAFNEVTIGLVPAIISPFIIRRMGFIKAKEMMLSGSHFNGTDAKNWGLIDYVIDEFLIESFISSLTEHLLKNSPHALKSTKKLLLTTAAIQDENIIFQLAAKEISNARISKDGQEGMKAFIEKRKPNW